MPSTRCDDVLEAARFETLRAALVDLTPAQALAVDALAIGSTHAQAVEIAGVTRENVTRWVEPLSRLPCGSRPLQAHLRAEKCRRRHSALGYVSPIEFERSSSRSKPPEPNSRIGSETRGRSARHNSLPASSRPIFGVWALGRPPCHGLEGDNYSCQLCLAEPPTISASLQRGAAGNQDLRRTRCRRGSGS